MSKRISEPRAARPFMHRMRTSLAAIVLASYGLTAAYAATPSNGDKEPKLVARPLTPQEIKNHNLPADTQKSGGLFTVGTGIPVYLEAQVPIGTVVNGVAWSLEVQQQGSTAVLSESPLGADIPIYNPGDRAVRAVAGRKVLKPDLKGIYKVKATITTDTGELVVEHEVTGAHYVGVGTIAGANPSFPQCALCHKDKAQGWAATHHSSALARKIDGIGVSRFPENCVSCHSTGFDSAETANNGGFDDIAHKLEWSVPETLQPGNFDSMPAELKALSNVQCEVCHGPGSEHFGQKDRISVSTSSGDCGQCHDSAPYHTKNTEWNLSKHAVATRYPTGEGRESCVGCHSGIGFIDRIDGVALAERRTEWEAIVCATCHDPHEGKNPHQLRRVDDVTLMNGAKITEGGNGRICMNCHIARRDANSYVTKYSSHFGPHYGPQTDMLAGTNAIEYGKKIPSSGHLYAVPDSCATCHMQTLGKGDPANHLAGGHTYKVKWDKGTPGDPSDDVGLVNACVQCHGPVESLNFARQDYNGDGIVEGVQTEVEKVMQDLAMLLPPLNEPKVAVTADYTPAQLKAAYNYLFVQDDKSKGVHNTAYAVGIMKASIADLLGTPVAIADNDRDGLPDEWEIAEFGSLTAQSGQGDADGDGLTNLFEYSAGLKPNLVDSDGDGFNDAAELHAATDPANGADKPDATSKIYPAAEFVFFSETGKTYQVQAIQELGTGGWTNVSDPVKGSGDMVQMFISTREEGFKFYRVVEVSGN